MSIKFIFERTGGLTSIPLSVQLDTAKLPVDEAHKLEELVKTSDFFHMPSVEGPPAKGADLFEYTIRVETDTGQSHTLRTRDDAISPKLEALLDELVEKAIQEARRTARGSTRQ